MGLPSLAEMKLAYETLPTFAKAVVESGPDIYELNKILVENLFH